jgi:ectoine hydroxylase-related dioxygenase (phytanoyl-CoA dioxygenase family)
MTMELKQFSRRMKEKGWVLLQGLVPPNLIARMTIDLEAAYLHCRAIQERNGIAGDTENTVHHLIGQGASFLEYLDGHYIHPYLEQHFSGNYVLNSFGAALNKQQTKNYAHNIHRDVRSYSREFPLIINTLVMLDDFTEENGATLLLSGSHLLEEKPEEGYFSAYAEPILGPAGSILIFDSNVWHAAGKSRSSTNRRSVTPMYSRPFVKSQFDYPRVLGYERGAEFSELTRQVLGYNARIPASLDEWYQPPAKRMYKSNQG